MWEVPSQSQGAFYFVLGAPKLPVFARPKMIFKYGLNADKRRALVSPSVHHKNRYCCVIDEGLRDAAEDDFAKWSAAKGTDDQQIGAQLNCGLQ